MTEQTPEPAVGNDKTETPTEKYLRQIRNVVVAAFVIWILGGITAGIVYGVATCPFTGVET